VDIISYAIKSATNSVSALTEKSYKIRVILKYGLHRAIKIAYGCSSVLCLWNRSSVPNILKTEFREIVQFVKCSAQSNPGLVILLEITCNSFP
jgi:hypothetical protein